MMIENPIIFKIYMRIITLMLGQIYNYELTCIKLLHQSGTLFNKIIKSF